MLKIIENYSVSNSVRFIFSLGNCYSGGHIEVICFPSTDFDLKVKKEAKAWSVLSKRDDITFFCETKEEDILLAKEIVQKEILELQKELTSFLNDVKSFSLPE